MSKVKDGAKPYEVPPRCMVYALQQPFKDEKDQLQEQQIIVPLDVNEISEWCNNLLVVPKPDGKVWLCLDPARQNQVLIRPVQRGSTTNDIFPKLTFS